MASLPGRLPPSLPSLGSIAALAGLVVVLATGDCGSGDSPSGGGGGDPGRGDSVTVPVERVIDGDTVEVTLDGVEEDVRYIGIDTPESVEPGAPVECYGLRAKRFNERLVGGRRVRLTFDSEARDDYGRLLAYVHLGDRFVNAELMRSGYATTLTIAPNDTHARLFARLEREASVGGRGLWGACRP